MSQPHQLATGRTPPTGPARPVRPRRRHAVVAAAALALLLGPSTATAASAAESTVDPALVGLYGTSDPTYDGVFRQSLGILGILAADEEPSDEAVEWLLDQQCSDGGFMAFNPDPTEPCVTADPANFAGEDTNSTALAVQALNGIGADDEAEEALAFLADARNDDGGWPYIPGGDSDPNSTGVVLTAFSTDGDPVDQDVVDYVASFQVGCDEPAEDQGGIASPYSGGAPDVLATVQAVPGVAGLSLLDGPAATGTWVDDAPAYACPVDDGDAETVAGWGSAWLEGQVADDAVSGGNAAWAVLSFASTRTGLDEAKSLYAGLASALGPPPKAKATDEVGLAAQTDEDPGALGLAALAGTTLGESEDVAGFAARIAATVTVLPTDDPSPSPTPNPGDVSDDGAELPDTGTDPTLIAVGALLVLLGTGLVVATRGRRREAPRA